MGSDVLSTLLAGARYNVTEGMSNAAAATGVAVGW